MRKIPSPETFRQNVAIQFKKSTSLSKREVGNLERGIFNYSIRDATLKNVVVGDFYLLKNRSYFRVFLTGKSFI